MKAIEIDSETDKNGRDDYILYMIHVENIISEYNT